MLRGQAKITPSHLSRRALVYVRQSSLAQVRDNTESTARQYDLVNRAGQLGWPREAIRVVDADLGVSGSVLGQREGFESLVAEVALGQVGIILALEASRLARDNAAWYRLLDLAEGDLSDHALEPGPLPGHRPGDAQVAVDDPDRLPRPAQLPGAAGQVILAGGTGGVFANLKQGRLADVDESLPRKMVRPDLADCWTSEHRRAPSH